jgi:hypothetical protein
MATWRAKGTDLRRVWILEEVGCCLQEGVWSKRNVFRKIQTQGNCGLRKELAAAGRKMTRCAKVAQHKGCRLQGRSYEEPLVKQGQRKNETRINLQEEPEKDGRSEGDN